MPKNSRTNKTLASPNPCSEIAMGPPPEIAECMIPIVKIEQEKDKYLEYIQDCTLKYTVESTNGDVITYVKRHGAYVEQPNKNAPYGSEEQFNTWREAKCACGETRRVWANRLMHKQIIVTMKPCKCGLYVTRIGFEKTQSVDIDTFV